MKHVLITISGGIIDRVTFYDDQSIAVRELARFARNMNPEKEDAAVYGPYGLIANAKLFMDEDDQVSSATHRLQADPSEIQPIYTVANPRHSLGFVVVSPFEPLGYADPLMALSILERMRKEEGTHINLYRLELVKWKVASRRELEKYNADLVVDDFEYSLVSEFLR